MKRKEPRERAERLQSREEDGRESDQTLEALNLAAAKEDARNRKIDEWADLVQWRRTHTG
jgi:hypothetical protein